MDSESGKARMVKMMYPCGIEPCRSISPSYEEMLQHIKEDHLARLPTELVGPRKFLKIGPGVWRDPSVRIGPGPSSQAADTTTTGTATDPSIDFPSFGSLPLRPLLGSIDEQRPLPQVVPSKPILASQAASQASPSMTQDLLRSPSPAARPSHSTPLDKRSILPPTQSQDGGAAKWPPSSPFVPVTQPLPATQILPPFSESETNSAESSQQRTESGEPASVSYHSESSKRSPPKVRALPSTVVNQGPSRALSFGMALGTGVSKVESRPKKLPTAAAFPFDKPGDGSPESGRSATHYRPSPSPTIGQGGVGFDWARH